MAVGGAGGEHTVVLTVQEARHFPRRPGYSLVVEGRFDGEALLTDPVPHDGSAVIQNELVRAAVCFLWELAGGS